MDTFPAVMRLCFPGVQYRFDRQDSVIVFPNQSSIFFGGLDDAERTEKILGLEFSTVYLNEASQISFGARNMLLTRLAQKSDLIIREYIDANPPTMDHWLYSLFELQVDPKSGEPLTTPEMYATMILNPEFNRENLSFDYLEQLEALPERERRRFLLGEYQTTVDCALWHMDKIRRLPAIDALNRADAARKMRRIIVAIDPSGASGPDDVRSDEIGIIVCGLDSDGNGHVLEDASIKEGPAGWAARALKAFDDWGAERLVAEKNFGGALVEATIRSIRGHAPVKMVSAARGKVARAEPVAAIYELGRVFHHGRFHALEDQLCRFSASGYQGARSPDRADALVWGLSTLMLETQTSTTWGPSLNFAR